MAPSIPLVAALLTASHAAELDESSMLQMPVVEHNLETDQDECRCPGYYQPECEAEAAQGCVWSDAGSSNGPWCQCLNPDTRPPVDPATVTYAPANPVLPPAPAPVLPPAPGPEPEPVLPPPVNPPVLPPAPPPTHYLVVNSWPEHAWGAWDTEARNSEIEKCLPKEQTTDTDGSGYLFTSCCTSEGAGMSRDCGSTRNTDFDTAVAQCASQGGRLCTADEAMSQVTVSQGCSVDGPSGASGADLNRLWTSTPCTALGETISVHPQWTLVVQYGNDGYNPTSDAAGEPSESETGFAKLSDGAINALPSGGDAAYDYYMLSSSSAIPNARDSIILRVTGAFDDTNIVYGFSDWEVCTAATFEECTQWSVARGGSHGIDTYYPSATNNCDRWFTGYQNSAWCWPDQSSGKRCWATGNTCSLGSHAIRTDVKMYKMTA